MAPKPNMLLSLTNQSVTITNPTLTSDFTSHYLEATTKQIRVPQTAKATKSTKKHGRIHRNPT